MFAHPKRTLGRCPGVRSFQESRFHSYGQRYPPLSHLTDIEITTAHRNTAEVEPRFPAHVSARNFSRLMEPDLLHRQYLGSSILGAAGLDLVAEDRGYRAGEQCGLKFRLTVSKNVDYYVDMFKKDLRRHVLEQIRNQIITFKLLPGVRISDKEVAEQLGISRTPVREALIHLVEQGLLEARHNRGFTVKIFTTKEIEDLYTLRANLECMAVGLTTGKLGKSKIEDLQGILNSYDLLKQAQDLAGFNSADEQFHDRIAEFSEHALLVQHLRSLHAQVRIVRRYDHLRVSSFQETHDEHQAILDCMVRGDSTRAQRAMSRHILHSMKVITGIIGQT